MKIEFATIGDGTNVEVRLTEDLGGAEATVDRFYSAQHRLDYYYNRGGGMVRFVNVREEYERLEELMLEPIIGGKLNQLHPYWHERAEKRKQRDAN